MENVTKGKKKLSLRLEKHCYWMRRRRQNPATLSYLLPYHEKEKKNICGKVVKSEDS